MTLKRWIGLTVLAAVVFSVAGYGWHEYNRAPADTATARPDLIVTEAALIGEFDKDPEQSNIRYHGKILRVTGTVQAVENGVHGFAINLHKGEVPYIIHCSFDGKMPANVPGACKTISIQGAYVGFERDDLLGNAVILNRCAVVEPRR